MHQKSILAFIIIIILGSCHNKPENASAENIESSKNKDSLVVRTLTKEEKATLKTEKLKKRNFPDTIHCKGIITTLPKHTYSVSPALKGFLKKFFHNPGDQIKKGEPLAVLTHPEYLKLQQKYLTTKSHHEFYKTNFTRQGELAIESAGSLKEMQKAQRVFEENDVRLKSLEKQLSMLNIDSRKLEKGNLSSSLTLYAPVSGIISECYLNTGQMADENNPVCKIIDKSKLVIQINIPGKYINQVQKGREMQFFFKKDTMYKTTLIHITKAIHKGERNFKAYAGINNKTQDYHPGMIIKTIIPVDSIKKYAIPETAIVEYKNENWVFVETPAGYQLKQVKTEQTMDNYISIKNYKDLKKTSIVRTGSDLLYKKLTGQ